MKKILLVISLLFLMQAAIAVPAKPGLIKVTQADGTSLTVKLYGDEFFSYMTTADGYQIEQQSDGNYYYFAPSMTRSVAKVQAHEPAQRTAAERQFLSLLPIGGDVNYISMGFEQAKLMRAERANSTPKSTPAPYLNRAEVKNELATKGLVIVVQYSDIKLQSEHTITSFTNLLNQKDYSLNGGTGSSRDFYRESSMGTYDPEFVVCPQVITLSNPRKYYGQATKTANDIRPREMIVEACIGADPYVDFSQFDSNGDGNLDNVFVYFAGNNQAEGATSDAIWPHQWVVANLNVVLDGVRIWNYACTSELRGANSTTLAGIGTFTHEFGHVLDLPDLYDADYEGSGGVSPGLYYISTMCSGPYNNNGNTPPYFTALERWLLGWNTLTELTEGEHTLKPINIENNAWKISTSDPDEFYLIEARDGTKGWDKYIVASGGLLIYHIDRSAKHRMGGVLASDRWKNNSINDSPTNECAKLIESSGYNVDVSSSDATQDVLFYPGKNNVRGFNASSYGGVDNSGTKIVTGLENIYWNGSELQFTAVEGEGKVKFAAIKFDKTEYREGSSFTPALKNAGDDIVSQEWVIDGQSVAEGDSYTFSKVGKTTVICKIYYTDQSVEVITRILTIR